MKIAREEIFGPVMSVIRFKTEAEAIAMANDSSYGLQASVWSHNINRAHRVARALRAGTVHVNQYDEDDITVPFGGFKQSGNGRDKSLHAFDKYTELKTTWIRIDAACRRHAMNHSLNEQLMARKAAATPRGVGVMGSFFADRAENAELWDVEGRRFIDFAGGIAVMNTGHGHPKVVAAIEAQLKRFTHTCYQVVPYESYIALAEKLNAMTPGTHAKKTALFSTGAEAIENAIKIARSYTKRSRRDRLQRRLPRPQPVRRVADRQGAALQGRLRALPARDLPRALPLPLRQPRRGRRRPCSTSSRPTSSRAASRPSCSSRCRAKAAST